MRAEKSKKLNDYLESIGIEKMGVVSLQSASPPNVMSIDGKQPLPCVRCNVVPKVCYYHTSFSAILTCHCEESMHLCSIREEMVTSYWNRRQREIKQCQTK